MLNDKRFDDTVNENLTKRSADLRLTRSAFSRSIFWHSREPYRPCDQCGFPFGLHRRACFNLAVTRVSGAAK